MQCDFCVYIYICIYSPFNLTSDLNKSTIAKNNSHSN